MLVGSRHCSGAEVLCRDGGIATRHCLNGVGDEWCLADVIGTAVVGPNPVGVWGSRLSPAGMLA